MLLRRERSSLSHPKHWCLREWGKKVAIWKKKQNKSNQPKTTTKQTETKKQLKINVVTMLYSSVIATSDIVTNAVNCANGKGLCGIGDIWSCTGMKCFCTGMQHFFMVEFDGANPSVIDKLQQKWLAPGNCLLFPVGLNPLTWNWFNIQTSRCFKQHISGACPALDMLTPGREHSPLSLTLHLLPGQKRQHPSCAKCVKHHCLWHFLKHNRHELISSACVPAINPK